MSDRTSIGVPPEDEKCPICKTPLDSDCTGYGLAYGGMGAYMWCANDDCNWFYKTLDSDE